MIYNKTGWVPSRNSPVNPSHPLIATALFISKNIFTKKSELDNLKNFSTKTKFCY
jgi:hypothetical protein